mgnify:CR=1 FL=1
MNQNLANQIIHFSTTINSMNKNKFTPELISELKGFYVERVVDNMDTKDLVNYVMDDLDRYYEKQSDVDFLEDAQNYWEDHFDEVVEEIEDYLKCDFKKDRRNEA